jgi:hypothetical protein
LGAALLETARGAFVPGFALAGLAAVVAPAIAVIVQIALRKPPAEKDSAAVGTGAA